MSWSGGSEIMSQIISNIKDKMDPEDRETLYKELITSFEDKDCDTLYECLNEDSVFDKVYKEHSFFAMTETDFSEDEWDDQDNTAF
jgi:hypothetical protein